MERIEEIVREWTEKRAVTVDNIPVLFATITAQRAEITRLTAELARVERVRDAAMGEIDKACENCAHFFFDGDDAGRCLLRRGADGKIAYPDFVFCERWTWKEGQYADT